MTLATLLRRSLSFYWRTHLGVLAGAAVATAVLVGALAVGDSVRHSLGQGAMERLGSVELATSPGNRPFGTQLARRLAEKLKVPVAPVLMLRAVATTDAQTARANGVQVIGTDRRFWSLANAGDPLAGKPDSVVINPRLAKRLGCRLGQEIVLRIAKPSLLPAEAPLSLAGDNSVAARLTVARIASGEELGNFNLAANQLPPYNAFVSLQTLQRLVDLEGRANTLLAAAGATLDEANNALGQCWRLADAGLELRELAGQELIELRSERVFIAPAVAAAASRSAPAAQGILTYFVNELRAGDRSAPYSFVAAIGPMGDGDALTGPIPPEMGDDEIVINQWLAEDLQAKAGDQVELKYFVLGPMRTFIERTSRFTVRRIVAVDSAAGRDLMPQFPGLADVENCRDWQPGIPIDLDLLRDKDQRYWQRHGGTPKAFVTLAAGRRIWVNRFGDLTAVRYDRADIEPAQLASRILAALDPASIALFFVPVRQQALAASGGGMDFGQLFVGLSFFIIVAGLLLMALLLALEADQRQGETGILLAVGLRGRSVRRLLLAEGGMLAAAGVVVGCIGGLGYAKGVIGALGTIWSPAVAGAVLRFHVAPATVIKGGAISLVVGLVAMWLVLRGQAHRPARQLLAYQAGEAAAPAAGPRRWIVLTVALASAASAGWIVLNAVRAEDQAAVAEFFAAGGLLLIAGLASCCYLLMAAAGGEGAKMSDLALAVRNAARRRWRSMAVVAMLACGCFLIVAVGANRLDSAATASQRSSGTGGFALVGRSVLPVYQDLNSPAGRDAYGLSQQEMARAEVLPLRVREGDDASCLNLNRAQVPRLLGVRPSELHKRGAFRFIKTVDVADPSAPWNLLSADFGPDVVPAIGDDATITWALGKKLGDTLDYIDDSGHPFHIRIVAVLGGSIFQGSLLVCEQAFVQRFGSAGGYREFLIDAPRDRADAVSASLERALERVGLEVSSAAERLAVFNTVQNTYLSIFQALGGLGMLLGTVAVGIVTTRNVLERRGELALMRAVGFTAGRLKWLVFLEHCGLLALGITCGTVAAVIAVLPALRSAAKVPYWSLAATLLAVAVSGAGWVLIATTLALRRPMLEALRNE